MRGSSRAVRTYGTAARTECPAGPSRVEADRSSQALLFVAGAVIAIATLVVYAPVWHHDFIALDDDVYVTDNRHVQAGLTADGIVWAFTTAHSSFWQPLTWLSHMTDCQLFGMNAGAHHLTNVALHVANVLLLLGALHGLTGTIWRSALTAAVFALHPLHVESVAWVAERKDVLSTTAAFAALWAYSAYVKRPGRIRLAWPMLAFAVGLLAKPMIVTLPAVLLLLDWWPLDRLRTATPVALVAEKLPFFVLALGVSILTVVVAARTGAVVSLAHLSIGMRVQSALVSYVRYLGKAFWPARLAVFYPLPKVWPVEAVVGAGLLFASITAAVVFTRRGYPYLAVGWLWFIATFAPVIGLFQSGRQAMADRFTYVPLIGLTIAVLWGAESLLHSRPTALRAATAAMIFVIAALGIASRRQVETWHDSVTLFTHALAVTTDNAVAHNNLGYVLVRQGKTEEAVAHFRAALAIDPGESDALYNLGDVLLRSDRVDDAVAHFSGVVAGRPGDPVAHHDLGKALAKRGDIGRAADEFTTALRLQPNYPDAHYNLGVVLATQGKPDEAIVEFTRALEDDPHHPQAHNAIGSVLLARGRAGDAIPHLVEAVRFDPGDPANHYNLGVALLAEERTADAVSEFREAVRLKPDLAEAHGNLAIIYAKQGRIAEARTAYATAVRLRPDLATRLPQISGTEPSR